MQNVQNAVTQVLPILAHLKVHYQVLGTWVHILLHLFVTANDTFTFIYVLEGGGKSAPPRVTREPKNRVKNTQFYLSFWMKWLFCNLQFSTLDLWPLAIFELLNSSFIWSNEGRVQEFKLFFWTLELLTYLNI